MEPTRNFNDTHRLDVGTTGSGTTRSLVKFPLTNVPAGVQLDSAVLRMHYSKTHTSDAFAVPIEAHRATGPWSAATATWNNTNGLVGLLGVNQVVIDDDDPGTSQTGNWPHWPGPAKNLGVNADIITNSDAVVPETYTWAPRLTEAGDYRVDAHYLPSTDRSTAVPYTITRSGGTSNATLNQTVGTINTAVWGQLGTFPFAAGTTGKVTVGDVANKFVIGDAIRFTKFATATKGVNQWGLWHEFAVRDIVQNWLNGTEANNGIVLKAADESVLGRGGPRYEGAENAYNGENEVRPKLVLTWGRPSVNLAPVSVAHATGGELSWSGYVDPSASPDDDAVEYQVHRSVFQTFTPQASTLIAPLPTGARSFVDTTATPTPAESDEPFGNAFYYMVAVKTRDGEVIPSATQLVRLPKAGQVFRTIAAVADTTVTSGQPDAGHDVVDGHPDVGMGNLAGTFGKMRALVRFPGLSAIPVGATVLDAQVRVWSYFTDPRNNATYELRPLTRAFDEATATWNRASSGTAWTTPGGDAGPVVSTTGNFTNDPAWRSWDATAVAQNWISTPASNLGVMVKVANETSPLEESLALSSESAEPALRPQLFVTYTEKTTESTYFAPGTPAPMTVGATETVPVTLTNTTNTTWNSTDRVLSYRWALPDGTDVTNSGNQVETALPTVAPGVTVTVNATVKAPAISAVGNKREAEVLTWEVKNKSTGQWLSQSDGIGGLAQNVSVAEPTSDQLGLEKFYQYSGMDTGGGGSISANLFAGNAVWGYNALSNPGRGLSTFVRVTYNSQDSSDTPMGFGWSASTSTVQRLGTALDFHPPGQSWPAEIRLTDGDGTTHLFTLNKHGSTDETVWDYDHPAGVHLYLRKSGNSDPARKWVMTAPDRTAFFFDDKGYQSATVDKNGNQMLFTYEERRSNNKPTKFLRYLTDPAGRQTLTLNYYAKGESYTFIDDAGNEVSGSNLTNPKIIDKIKDITDVSGRRIDFRYTDKGLMAKMVDGANDPALAKTFRFGYDALQGNKNVKMVRVTDPRNNATQLAYYSPPNDDPKFHWRVKTITDRLNQPAQIAYSDPDGSAGDKIQTVVTDAETHATTYLMDALGRPEQITNAKNQITRLHFDADHNVDQLREDNGALTTWTYDPKTGLPQQMKDPKANAEGTPAHVYTYRTSLNGFVADLTTKASPEGRTWTFGYDTLGNLLSVTDPAGTATSTAGDFTTVYTYDATGQLLTARDANQHTTTYSNYDPNGYPKTITDPLTRASTFTYDARGNVRTVTDARGKVTTQAYDLFGRPRESVTPKDQAAGLLITTPAPVYDPNDNITTATAPNGAVTTAVYNGADEMTSQTMPRDTPTSPVRTSTFGYDKVGNLTSVVEPNGTLTTTDPNDFTTRYVYDEIYQLTQATDATGGRSTYTYDRVGNLTTQVDPRKNATPDLTDVTATFAYDVNHRVTDTTDADGNTTHVTYDRDSNPVTSTDAEGNTTTTVLDARGKPSEMRVPFTTSGGNTVFNTTRYTYDQAGNPLTVETPRGVATPAAGDFTAATVYDELNRPTEQRTAFDPADPRYNTADVTRSTYDELGRIATLSAPPSNGQSVRNDTSYTYFDNGWTRTTTDPWDIATTYDYNPLGQQTVRTLSAAGGSVTRSMSWAYFPDGKLQSRSDDGIPVGRQVALVDNSDVQNVTAVGSWPAASSAAGKQGFDYQTNAAGTGTDTFSYNLLIPQTGTYEVFARYPAVTGAASNTPYAITHSTGTVTKPVNQTTGAGTWVSLGSFTFTAGQAGQKIVVSDAANGTVVADAVKLVRDNTAETDNERVAFTHGYDPNGNLTALSDASPGSAVDSYAVTYDQLNRVDVVQEKLGATVKHTTDFDYDPNSNITRRTHDTAVDTYTYNTRDLIDQVTNAEPGTATKTSTFTYTARGQLLRQAKPNGNAVTNAYFLSGALQHSVEKKSDNTTVIAEHTLGYDPNGNRTIDAARLQNADDHAAMLNRTSTYTYDPRDRVASVTNTGIGPTPATETYIHDANNNVISQTVKSQTTTFGYDRNRLLTSTAGGITAGYNYDPFGRLDTITAGGAVQASYTYDGFDRTTRQTSRESGTDRVTLNTYDPLDRTASRTENAGTTDAKTTAFAYLGLTDQLLTELVNGQATKTYQYSPSGVRLSQTTRESGSTEDAFYGYNPHTDVEALTTSSGDTKATYGYTAYGSNDTTTFTGIDKPGAGNPTQTEPYNVYRYNAKRLNPTTGDYDMGFRDYNPGLN